MSKKVLALWGAPVFLHESNAIPGRANRFLAPLAEGVFVGFEAALDDLRREIY